MEPPVAGEGGVDLALQEHHGSAVALTDRDPPLRPVEKHLVGAVIVGPGDLAAFGVGDPGFSAWRARSWLGIS